MAPIKRDVVPLLDIQSAEFAHQYQLGVYWAQYGDEQGNGPQSDVYFIVNVTALMESGHVNDLQSAWFPNLGFFLGVVHGGVLNPRTNELWPYVTTLVTLSDPYVTRGYRAGRVWFFYEVDPTERRLTDASLVQRLYELAAERHEYKDEEGTTNFVLGLCAWRIEWAGVSPDTGGVRAYPGGGLSISGRVRVAKGGDEPGAGAQG